MATLTGLLLLVVFAAAVPLVLRFRLVSADKTLNEVTLEWAFGLVRVPLSGEDRRSAISSVPASKQPADTARGSPDRHRRGTSASPFEQARRLVRLLRDAALRRRLLRFLRTCWQAVHKRIVLHARIGLGDPADTGQLWGLLGPASPWLATRETTVIELEPDFTEAAFALDGEGVIRLIPLQLLWLTVALMLSPALWRAVATLRGTG
jgi:hypothetical protein